MNGGPSEALGGGDGVGGANHLGDDEREERGGKARRERRKKGRTAVQVCASRAAYSGATGDTWCRAAGPLVTP
jgi:hypothetical protein